MLKIGFLLFLLLLTPQLNAFAVTVELPKTGQNLCYDLAGNVIPCAGTGQDGETQVGVPLSVPRFTDNLDGTVTDNSTGLIWLKNAVCPEIQSSIDGSDWPTALAVAGALHDGQCGLSDGSAAGDWRLPNASELASLIDLSHYYPALTTGHPFQNADYHSYWTSTTYPMSGAANAEGVILENGAIRADVKNRSKIVWPVRGTSTTIAQTGQNTCWDWAGQPVPCTGSGEDGEKQAGAPWPVPRFIDNGDGTLVDLLTNLVWLKNANCFGNRDTQDTALSDAKTLASGACGLGDGSAAGDWRLPNRNEMRSLTNYEQADGGAWLDAQGFVNAVYSYYWTSDSFAGGVDKWWLPAGADPSLGDKWMVNTNGSSWLSSWVIINHPELGRYVWPVRGPYDASCGSSNGKTFSSQPTTDLCSTGNIASAVTGTGPWNWTCSVDLAGTISVGCSASYAPSAPPTVSLTAPASGATYTAPAAVAMTAVASPGSGASVKQVDFYNGTTLVGTSTASPYSYTLSNVAAGSYSLTAKVTDTLGATATSAAVGITVNPASVPPTVRLTAPASGATYTAPAAVTLTATASPGTGALVKQVEFYNGTTLLGTSTASPYSYSWSNVAAGSYSLTAKVTDTLGATATSAAVGITVTPPPLPPTVSLTAPSNGATYAAPASVTITATATAGTGVAVKRIDFYSGTTLLGTRTASPYSYTWKKVPAGSYSLTAKVTDTLGVTATSAAVGITVSPAGGTPTVSLTAPASGATYTAPAAVVMTAAASPGTRASVKRVDFYNGTTLLGTSSASPYSYTWSNVAAGSYSLTAKVTDTRGATATSAAIGITVSPVGGTPTVRLTAPFNGATYAAPASVTINATATTGTGAAVKQVDFYNGTTLLASKTASPYSYTWSNVAAGSYSLTAKVTDTLGGTATSSPVGITVTSSAVTYASDTFQGTGTGTLLQNHVGDTGAGWALLYGTNTAFIDGPNSAVYSSTDANYYSTFSIPANDYSVLATVHMNTPASGTNCYISGRTNPSSHARYVAGHTQGLGWGLYYMDGLGHETRLAPLYGQSILSSNTTYTLELKIVGSSISMYVNNVLAASVTNSTLSTGNHAGLESSGSGSGSSSSYEVYDWKVTSPSSR